MIRANKLWLLALVLILLATGVSGLGLSPAGTTLDFEPGMEKDIVVKIINSEHKDHNILIYASGELAEYMTFDEQNIKMSATEQSKEFVYHVKLPQGFDEMGEHLGRLVVTSLPEGVEAGAENLVKVTSSVASELKVFIPYEGIYLEPTAYVTGSGVDEPVIFTIGLKNLGTVDLQTISAHIRVYNPSSDLMAELDTTQTSLKVGAEGKVEGTLSSRLTEGTYTAVIELNYNGEKTLLELGFTVGSMNVEIISATVQDFNLGGINRFDILVQNTWNKRIEHLYGEGQIRDNNNKNYGTFKTPTVGANPRDIVALEGFWDTKEVFPGFYTLDVIVYYANKVTRKSFEMEASANSLKTSVDISGRVVGVGASDSEKANNLLALIFIIVGIILIINIGIVLYFVKLRGKIK